MMNCYPPIYRAWHHPSQMMYDVASIEWQQGGENIVIIGIIGQETGVSGSLSDFVLMRKSSHTDIDGFPIFSGDIVQLGQDSDYPAELLTVTDFEDGLCFNFNGTMIPLNLASRGKVVGNIFSSHTIY